MISNDDFKLFSLYCGKLAESLPCAAPMSPRLIAARQVDGLLKLDELAGYVAMPDKTGAQALVCADTLLKSFGMDIVGVVTEVEYKVEEFPVFRKIFVEDGISFGPDTVIQALEIHIMDSWREATVFIAFNTDRSLNYSERAISPVPRQGINPVH